MNKDNTALITDYMSGDKKHIALEAIEDDALREQVALARQMNFTLKHRQQIQAQALLNDILPGIPTTTDHDLTERLAKENVLQLPNKKLPNISRWLLGGSLILALVAILVMLIRPVIPNTTENIQSVIQNHIIPIATYTSYDVEKERDYFSLGFEAYDKGSYDDATKHLNAYLKNNPNDEDTRLYLGISELMVEKYAASLLNLRLLSKSNDPFVKEHSEWYLALAMLMDNNKTEAFQLLELISENSAHRNHTKAQNLLNQIKK